LILNEIAFRMMTFLDEHQKARHHYSSSLRSMYVTTYQLSHVAVKSTKMGECSGSTGGGRLSEKEERKVSEDTCQKTKIADVIAQSHTLATRREKTASFICLRNSVDDSLEAL
jgi:hypothetical protein